MKQLSSNKNVENKRKQKESCTTMFIATLFTTARTWKQPKCPSTDEWIKKMWYLEDMGRGKGKLG